MAARIKKGDLVEVITGSYGRKAGKPGHVGRVTRIDNKKERVIVEGANRVWKHVKPSQRNPQGGRIQIEAGIHISNVLPVDPSTGKGTRVRFEMKGDTKHRVAATKKTGTDLGAIS